MSCRRSTAVLLTGAVALLAAGAHGQTTIAVDPTVEFQTIEGFGAHGAADVWWNSGPFYTADFGRIVIDDLGFTMIRNEFYPSYEPTNDNSDPNTLGTFSLSGEFGQKQKDYIVAMKNKAAASGEPLRFIATYWSPPAWMKVNNSTVGGNIATNILKTGVEAELGEYGVATVKAYKDQCGVDLYALSMQNESAFDEPYNSCVYSPTRYRDVFKVFGERVHATYPNVKLFGAEHMLANWGTFEGQLSTDTLARRHIGAFAVHGYNDGVHPTGASTAVNLWKRAATNSASASKPLWMTETSGYFETWTDCMQLAEMIYAGLKFGKIAAWVWWQLGGGDVLNEYNLMRANAAGMRAYIHKHFSRYVRPGAVGVGCVSSDSLLFTVGFRHKQNRTLTIILINANSSSRTVTLSGTQLPSFTAYRSTASERCAQVGTVTSGSVTLPASSVVTLFGQNYDPTTAVGGRFAGLRTSPRMNPVGASMFAIDGRTVVGSERAVANGVRYVRTQGAGGSIAVSREAALR